MIYVLTALVIVAACLVFWKRPAKTKKRKHR
jgi:hypothetical protein